jgi:simple sugar transport system substrate-binding protein
MGNRRLNPDSKMGRSRQLGFLLVAAFGLAAPLVSLAAPVVGAQPTTGPATTLSGGLKEAGAVKVIYVGCNAPTTFFWERVTRGAQEAANNLGIQYQYLYPQTADTASLNQTTEQAIAAQPDGLAVCGLDPNGQRSTIQQAVDAGIAVVLTPPENTITQTPLKDPKLPYIGQVGADEPSGGVLAASSAISRLGSKSMVCTQSQDDTTQGLRCKALVDTATSMGAAAQIQIVPNNQGQASDIMTNFLRAHPDVDTVVTTNADVAIGVVQAKQTSGINAHLVTFDLNDAVLENVQSGAIDYAIDQQQYWRGYIPVLLLTHYIRYGLVMANNYLTGPNIVDKSNVANVVNLVSQGIR